MVKLRFGQQRDCNKESWIESSSPLDLEPGVAALGGLVGGGSAGECLEHEALRAGRQRVLKVLPDQRLRACLRRTLRALCPSSRIQHALRTNTTIGRWSQSMYLCSNDHEQPLDLEQHQ